MSRESEVLTQEQLEQLLEDCRVVDELGDEKDLAATEHEICFGCHSY
jgi:hypothetical protein